MSSRPLKPRFTTTLYAALLCSMAYISLFLIRFPLLPSAPFLEYDLRDVFVTLGGFWFGPAVAFLSSFMVALLQALTIGKSFPFGFIMSTLSTASFACVAAVVFRKNPGMKNAILGVLAGCVGMCLSMLLWNWLITPLYLGIPRASVTKMLLPVILPFNVIKSIMNACFSVMLYRVGIRRGFEKNF